jgi:hypothetical protein
MLGNASTKGVNLNGVPRCLQRKLGFGNNEVFEAWTSAPHLRVGIPFLLQMEQLQMEILTPLIGASKENFTA